MYALFDDAGRFHAGRVLSDADTSLQVELESGKRVKVKAANVLLRFDQPAPAELMARAQALAADIDLGLAWEFAPEEEFGFADLARDYFEPGAGPEKQAAALFRLFDAVKVGPMAWADATFKGFGPRGGFGVMLDDLAAAFCTLLAFALWRF